MQVLEVQHVRLNTGVKKPLQYLKIHALCVHLKEMEAFTMQPLHQGTDGDRGYFDLANVLRIGSKSTVMLNDKASLRRGSRIGHIEFYHTIVLCHRGIDWANAGSSCIKCYQALVRNFLRFHQDGRNAFVLKNVDKWITSVSVKCPNLEDMNCSLSLCP